MCLMFLAIPILMLSSELGVVRTTSPETVVQAGLSQSPPATAAPERPDAESVSHSAQEVTPPRVLSQVAPEFSEQERKKKISGSVLVGLVIDENGKPIQVHVLRSLADAQPKKFRELALSLDQKAIQAVQQYRFAPATRGGKPVPVPMKVEVNFSIF